MQPRILSSDCSVITIWTAPDCPAGQMRRGEERTLEPASCAPAIVLIVPHKKWHRLSACSGKERLRRCLVSAGSVCLCRNTVCEHDCVPARRAGGPKEDLSFQGGCREQDLLPGWPYSQGHTAAQDTMTEGKGEEGREKRPPECPRPCIHPPACCSQ